MLAVLLLNRMSTERRLALKKQAANTEKLQRKVPVTNYCRTCLSTEGLVPIFCDKDAEEKRSRDMLLVTGLEIKNNDGLSQKICSKCTDAISFVLQFRRTSRKAEKALLGMAAGTHPKLNKKYKLQKEPTRLKSEDIELDYSCDTYGDDFQNYDYECKEQVKSHIKQEPRVRKKRSRMPHQTSYKCNTCNKEFRMKATYKAHMRFHTNFCVCESCGKRCRNNNQLQEHKRARHGLGRIHKCAYCEYSSATKEALTIHERRHTGERPYICDHCGAAFHRRSNLVQHIAIHLPEKNFQCDMCPKRLKSKKFLQIHKHNAHTGKRYGYLCGVCAHRFEKPNKVRAHTRRVHGLPDDQQGPVARVQL